MLKFVLMLDEKLTTQNRIKVYVTLIRITYQISTDMYNIERIKNYAV